MNYFRVEAGNGLCGCNEKWITATEEDDLNFYEDILQCYSYESGYAGIEYDEDMWAEYDEEDNDSGIGYENAICENSCWEKITEEEFVYLRDEEGWDER